MSVSLIHVLVFDARLPCPVSTWCVFFLLYLIIVCHVWLLSLRNLFFSNERQKECGAEGEERWGRFGSSSGRRNYNQDILHEKIIYFQ